MENEKVCDRAETRFQVFSGTVPFTPCSKHTMFYGLGMCDCTSERDKIYGKFIIYLQYGLWSHSPWQEGMSGTGWDAVPLLE